MSGLPPGFGFGLPPGMPPNHPMASAMAMMAQQQAQMAAQVKYLALFIWNHKSFLDGGEIFSQLVNFRRLISHSHIPIWFISTNKWMKNKIYMSLK